MYVAPDNRLFIVNGHGSELLLKTLKLAIETSGYKKIESYRIDPVKGLILQWHCYDGIELNNNTIEEILPIIENYLNSTDAEYTETKKWEGAFNDSYEEVLDSPGWVVYCEDWGHVGSDHYAIVAVKKAYMWYGK